MSVFAKLATFVALFYANRRAVEDDLLDTNRVVQIGLRGSGYEPGEVKWNRDQVHLITTKEIWADLFNNAGRIISVGPMDTSRSLQ